MGPWTALVILTVLYRNISSEHVTDTSNNDRSTRLLDFEDSCSCEDLDKSHSPRDAKYDDTVEAGSEDVFFRTRDLDDCPCRFRDSDSEGASSLLFPSAMRSAGTLLRPTEKKQELKPLFNPEVDLASSVLETLRIATDEEYEDALARDAAKSAARAVEDDMFGDAIPQESANIVSIVVNPKAADNDDIEPQASHIKQSRCIHPLTAASKPSLIFNNPRLSKIRPTIWNRNFYDMDSDIGASSVHEHVTPLDEERKDLSTNSLTFKSNTDFISASLKNGEDESYVSPYFKTFPLENKLKKNHLGSSPLLQSIRDKTIRSLPHLPKFKLQSLLPEKTNNNNDDLSPASSTVQEQAVKKIPYYRTNSKYENNKQNSRPLSLPNLLNLRDVELIPLKDLLSRQARKRKFNKPEAVFPSMYEYDDDVYSLENVGEDTKGWKTTPLTLINDTVDTDNTADPDSSPNRVNFQVTSKDKRIIDDHSEKVDEETNTKESDNRPFTTEILNTLPGVENVVSKFTLSDETGCIEAKKNDQDSITDASNHSNNRIDPTEARSIENQNVEPDYSNAQNIEDINESRNIQNIPQLKRPDRISIDKTISSIKNYILKKQEDLKNMNTNLKNKKILNQESKDILFTGTENHDCIDEALMQVTTFKPDGFNNDLKVSTDLTNPEESNKYKFNKPKTVFPSINENADGESSIENETKDTQSWITSPITLINDTIDDSLGNPESSPSSLNLQVIPKSTRITDDTIISEKEPTETNSNESEDGRTFSRETLNSLEGIENVLPKVTLSDDANCVEDRNNDQDSITDASNNIDNIIDQPEARALDNEITQPDYSDAQDIEDNNESNNIRKHSTPQLDKTISSIKKYILKKQEDLKSLKTNMQNKNMFNQEKKDSLVTREENQDCENEASMQVTTIKSNVLNNNLEVFTTTMRNLLDNNLEDVTTSESYISSAATDNVSERDDISMQDLQKMSDSMLQQEERELKNVECHIPSEKVVVKTSLDDSSRDSEGLDLDNSANTPTETVVKPLNLVKFQDKSTDNQDKSTEINNCKTDLASRLTDSNTDSSDIVVSSIPKENKILGFPSTINPAINLLNNPLRDFGDALKLPTLKPLPVVDDMRVKLLDLFDKSERDVENISPPAPKSHSESFDILNPVMATDASISNFQSKKPPLGFSDGINFDILNLRPQLSIFPDILKLSSPSYKTESVRKPISLKSALEDKRAKHSRLNTDKYALKSSPRETIDLNDILSIKPNLHNLRDRLEDSSVKATNNIQSTLKQSKNAFESKFRKLNNNNFNTLRSPIKSSQSLLDTFSQNNEDISDKLRALHVDFNDRLESVRNDLIDRSKLLTGSRGTKPNLRSSSNFHNQNKAKLPKHWQGSTRESKKSSARKQTPARFSSSPKALDQKKLKMPVAASVPVPRTVQVPELRATSAKSPPLTSRKASSLIPNTNDKLSKDFLRNLGGQAKNLQHSNTLLRNNNNLRKDKTIKVVISTTPRPEMYDGHKFRSFVPQTNRGKLDMRKMYEDHNGSPSEIKHTTVSVPNYNQQDKYRISDTDDNDEPLSNRLASTESNRQKAAKTALKSWPRATESAFLSKVKEAVRARLANGNSAKSTKTTVPTAEGKEKKEGYILNSDMARSASENKDIFDTSLKENVPYKCEMICTKQ